jgi:hypothetical protein
MRPPLHKFPGAIGENSLTSRVAGPRNTRSFDCVAVHRVDGNFAQDDKLIGRAKIPYS